MAVQDFTERFRRVSRRSLFGVTFLVAAMFVLAGAKAQDMSFN
jgi:hypothetical protein